MRGKQNNLNHILNICQDGSSTNVLQQLQSVTEQKVDKVDYQQQIERWNKYQELLDEIGKKCGRDVGVRLARNVKHNFNVFTDTSSAGLAVVGAAALLTLWGAFSIYSIYYLVGSIAALSFVGWQAFIRLHHPSVIHFKCSPALHIDEFAYMRQTIRGIPPAEHDPIVRLPVLEMSISRAWLAQQGMLKFMESLRDIKWERAEERSQQEHLREE
ncbi:MAG: hypothetical protein QXX64_05755 [Nitrososphaera sp.]